MHIFHRILRTRKTHFTSPARTASIFGPILRWGRTCSFNGALNIRPKIRRSLENEPISALHPSFRCPKTSEVTAKHPLRGSSAPNTGSARARAEPAGRQRRPRSRLAACASPQHRRCPIRRQLRVGLRCRATTADRPRPKKPRPQEPMRGLGRARLLKRHKAAWGQAKRHQPRT